MRGNKYGEPAPVASAEAVLSPGRTRATLAVVALSLMAVVSAVSGLNVALPELAIATGASQTELTWIVDAYTVVFAGLLLISGALGDRFGRKTLLAAGLVVFGAAAGAAFFTDSPTTLIGLRAFMGVGAAAIMPSTLSVITTSFSEEDRPRAVGVWVGVAGGGAVLGLFGTGLLLEWFDWNSFFALNVALALLGLVGTLLVVPNSTDEEPPALDVAGGLLSLVAVAGVVTGIIEGPERGWSDPVTVTALVTGVVAGVLFVLWERRLAHPLLDPRLFRLRGFSSGSLAVTAQFFCSFGLFFAILQYFQFVLGYSPLQAAAWLLPLPLVLIPTARNAPLLARRIGYRKVVPVGLALTATGLFVLSRVGTEMSYGLVLGGLIPFALGMGLAGTPSTTAITESLPRTKQGVASAVNDTARELGSAFGIAVLGSALTQTYRDAMEPVVAALPPQAAEYALRSVAFTRSPRLAELGEAGQVLADQGRAAFVDGISVALTTGAVIALVAAVVVWFVAGPSRERATAADATAQAAA